ncbi:MAG TPA: DUF3349 domain-containing protein, partial [Mycobacterium sp.]
STFQSVIDWLRAGYPDEGPRTGHSPLLALNGPIALSPRQTEQIVAAAVVLSTLQRGNY